MKTRRRLPLYMAHAAFYLALTLPAWATPSLIERGFGATLVCPFTVTGGPKLLDGSVEVSCFSDTACGTPLSTAPWGTPLGDPQPTMQNGVHTLSNEAMAAAGLTLNTTTQSIKIEIFSQIGASATLCMQATVSSDLFACTGGPYTLNINGLP
jgi:hypothetical protein